MNFKELNKALEDKDADHIKIINKAARFSKTDLKLLGYCVAVALVLIIVAILRRILFTN